MSSATTPPASSPESSKRHGCLNTFLATTLAISGLAFVNREMHKPPEEAHKTTTISWLGGHASTLTYERKGPDLRYASDSPHLVFTLQCSPDNVGRWTAEVAIWGTIHTRNFTVDSNQQTLSPCIKGKANPGYDNPNST